MPWQACEHKGRIGRGLFENPAQEPDFAALALSPVQRVAQPPHGGCALAGQMLGAWISKIHLMRQPHSQGGGA